MPRASQKRKGPKSNVLASMTGFGRAVVVRSGLQIEVEVKSYNSRYLEVSLKLPAAYSELELELRSNVSEKIARGRIEISINRQLSSASAYKINFNSAVFEAFLALYQGLCKQTGQQSVQNKEQLILELLKRKDVLEIVESRAIRPQEIALLKRCFADALEKFQAMRRREGNSLAGVIAQCLNRLGVIHSKLVTLAKLQAKAQPERIRQRIAKLKLDSSFDDTRLYSEAMLIVDKQDVEEEFGRLLSHFDQFSTAMQGFPAGRKLDFLTQEIQREFNTITSKCQNAEMQALVVDAKVEIERIREQLQNIE